MKYIGKYFSIEILLTRECTCIWYKIVTQQCAVQSGQSTEICAFHLRRQLGCYAWIHFFYCDYLPLIACCVECLEKLSRYNCNTNTDIVLDIAEILLARQWAIINKYWQDNTCESKYMYLFAWRKCQSD